MEIGTAEWHAGIQTNSESNTPCADSDLGPRLEDSGTSKDLPTLKPRVEGRNETLNFPGRGRILRLRPLSKTNFGASVNDVPHFST
ncbi:hypothetical protein AVEN_151711-1 [Araneus ventricosus]|uniref:Uncharacterized protein n=1 Tax=Araneus ventricosus TaxID=182803 RepID=A0A4Y2DQT4_ARAVE|nr:hypothetical protein AVEN_151711-1 [Araneus ventricosus]